jgi:hypothetical protein
VLDEVTVTVTVAETPLPKVGTDPETSTVFVVPIEARTIKDPVPVSTVTASSVPLAVVVESLVDREGVVGIGTSTVLVVPMDARTIKEPVTVITVTGSGTFKVG